MLDTAENSQWPMVAELRLQLRQHIETFPQVYRGERWYVLRDEVNGRHLRFNAHAYDLVGRLDGELSIQQIWDQMVESSEGEKLSQDDVVQILTQLFAIDALNSGLPADARDMFKRFQNEQRSRRQRAIMNPLSIRVPLLDPDKLLNRLIPWIRPFFSRLSLLLWGLIVGFGALLALLNAGTLSHAVNRDIISPENLSLMLFVYVSIKLVHEFAHALTVKNWGGEVHEMGITLLVFVPIPFVDASAAWGFRDKRKRAMVGAVGVIAELLIAALALFVWLIVEPGLLKDAALNAFLIGSISTLLFNANPLLRFDGYYVLQDLVEIPNLYTRSSRYYLYLIQRYIFGLADARSPVTADGERSWFIIYGLAALLYRLFILATIVLFLAESYLFAGVALGLWAVSMQLLMPIIRGLRYLSSSPVLSGKRFRAAGASTTLIATIAGLLIFMPVSQTTYAEGVVWMSDHSRVFAAADGFVTELLVTPGTEIETGTPLLRMRAPTLNAKIEKLAARRRELELQMMAEHLDRVQSDMTREAISAVDAELDLLRKQANSLLVKSEMTGTFVLPDAQHLAGLYLKQGDLIGYVVSPDRLIVRTVVPQSDIGKLRENVHRVEARLAERPAQAVDVHIVRETPGGSTILPNRALGAAGGGDIAIKMTDSEGLTAAEEVFQLDLGLPADINVAGVGERAYVRFSHDSAPLARQWFRSGRQLLLSRLNF